MVENYNVQQYVDMYSMKDAAKKLHMSKHVYVLDLSPLCVLKPSAYLRADIYRMLGILGLEDVEFIKIEDEIDYIMLEVILEIILKKEEFDNYYRRPELLMHVIQDMVSEQLNVACYMDDYVISDMHKLSNYLILLYQQLHKLTNNILLSSNMIYGADDDTMYFVAIFEKSDTFIYGIRSIDIDLKVNTLHVVLDVYTKQKVVT